MLFRVFSAGMAELVDAHVSEACVLTGVGVRLPLPAPILKKPVIENSITGFLIYLFNYFEYGQSIPIQHFE